MGRLTKFREDVIISKYAMNIHRIYKASLILLLAAGLPVGCIAVSEKPDQAISVPAAPAISYSPALSDSSISTIAGGGVGDGGLAVKANLYTPQAVAVDPEGNIFIACSWRRAERGWRRRYVSWMAVNPSPRGAGAWGGGRAGRAYRASSAGPRRGCGP